MVDLWQTAQMMRDSCSSSVANSLQHIDLCQRAESHHSDTTELINYFVASWGFLLTVGFWMNLNWPFMTGQIKTDIIGDDFWYLFEWIIIDRPLAASTPYRCLTHTIMSLISWKSAVQYLKPWCHSRIAAEKAGVLLILYLWIFFVQTC